VRATLMVVPTTVSIDNHTVRHRQREYVGQASVMVEARRF